MTSPIGFGGPQGGGDNGREFESFRQKRKNRRFKTDGGFSAPVTDAKSKLQRAIEDEERKEMVERQLAREVQEFVEETTRLAASILNQVSSQEAEHHHEQISHEMKEFFQATLNRAEFMLESLRSMESQGAAVAEVEATLANMTTRTLDEFRSEGSESLRDAHIGEDPHLKPLNALEEPETPQAGSLHLISKTAGWKEIDAPEDIDLESDDDEIEHLEADGSCEMEPLGDDFEFIAEDGDEAPVSGAWRAAQQDEDGTGTPIEEVTVETDFAADFVDDNEEEELAADPSTEAPAEPRQEAPAPVAEEAAKDDFPPFFEKWRHDKPGLKKALTVMVKNGLMTPDEARSIFTRA